MDSMNRTWALRMDFNCGSVFSLRPVSASLPSLATKLSDGHEEKDDACEDAERDENLAGDTTIHGEMRDQSRGAKWNGPRRQMRVFLRC